MPVERADLDGLVVHPVPDVEDIAEVVDLAALRALPAAQGYKRPGGDDRPYD